MDQILFNESYIDNNNDPEIKQEPQDDSHHNYNNNNNRNNNSNRNHNNNTTTSSSTSTNIFQESIPLELKLVGLPNRPPGSSLKVALRLPLEQSGGVPSFKEDLDLLVRQKLMELHCPSSVSFDVSQVDEWLVDEKMFNKIRDDYSNGKRRGNWSLIVTILALNNNSGANLTNSSSSSSGPPSQQQQQQSQNNTNNVNSSSVLTASALQQHLQQKPTPTGNIVGLAQQQQSRTSPPQQQLPQQARPASIQMLRNGPLSSYARGTWSLTATVVDVRNKTDSITEIQLCQPQLDPRSKISSICFNNDISRKLRDNIFKNCEIQLDRGNLVPKSETDKRYERDDHPYKIIIDTSTNVTVVQTAKDNVANSALLLASNVVVQNNSNISNGIVRGFLPQQQNSASTSSNNNNTNPIVSGFGANNAQYGGTSSSTTPSTTGYYQTTQRAGNNNMMMMGNQSNNNSTNASTVGMISNKLVLMNQRQHQQQQQGMMMMTSNNNSGNYTSGGRGSNSSTIQTFSSSSSGGTTNNNNNIGNTNSGVKKTLFMDTLRQKNGNNNNNNNHMPMKPTLSGAPNPTRTDIEARDGAVAIESANSIIEDLSLQQNNNNNKKKQQQSSLQQQMMSQACFFCGVDSDSDESLEKFKRRLQKVYMKMPNRGIMTKEEFIPQKKEDYQILFSDQRVIVKRKRKQQQNTTGAENENNNDEESTSSKTKHLRLWCKTRATDPFSKKNHRIHPRCAHICFDYQQQDTNLKLKLSECSPDAGEEARICELCGETGAVTRCYDPTCDKWYHSSCAIFSRGFIDFGQYDPFRPCASCPQHAYLSYKKNENNNNAKLKSGKDSRRRGREGGSGGGDDNSLFDPTVFDATVVEEGELRDPDE